MHSYFKTKNIILYVIVAFILYSIVDRVWLQDRDKNKEQSGGGKGTFDKATEVDILVLSPQNFSETIKVGGTLKPNEEVDLSTESSGKVVQINFKEGATVKTGDLLLKINDKDLSAQYQRAVFKEKLAKDREQRQAVLLEKEAVSQEEYDIMLTELNSLSAERQLIQAQIEKTEIRAPFSGVIGLRKVSLGAYVSPNQIVATLVDKHRLKLEFSIPEKYFSAIQNMKTVNFMVDGYTQKFEAEIYAIEPKIDPLSRTIAVRALVDNPGGRNALAPGAFAQIELNLNQNSDAVIIPAVAIIANAKGKTVWVKENGLVAARNIETGGRDENNVEVLKGLKVGDSVIVSGLMQIRLNMPITAKP